MNDFTKEELVDILECVSAFKAASIRGGFQYYDALNDKIQSLIDNYDTQCTHEPCLMSHKLVDGGSVGLITCGKCKVIL